MGVVDKLSNLLPGGDTTRVYKYECQECGNTFESAKGPDRAQCMDCLSNDVERQRT